MCIILADTKQLSQYVLNMVTRNFCCEIDKAYTVSWKLLIEPGRYNKIANEKRICTATRYYATFWTSGWLELWPVTIARILDIRPFKTLHSIS